MLPWKVRWLICEPIPLLFCSFDRDLVLDFLRRIFPALLDDRPDTPLEELNERFDLEALRLSAPDCLLIERPFLIGVYLSIEVFDFDLERLRTEVDSL